MNEKNNNNHLEENEEKKILELIDAHHEGSLLSSDDTFLTEYAEVLSLLQSAKTAIKPDAALLRKTLASLPSTLVPHDNSNEARAEGVLTPYGGSVSWLSTRVSSWKFATPVIVLFIAVATMIGASPKKGQAPTILPVSEEMISPLSGESPQSMAFSVTGVTPEGGEAPTMMMAKMSQTTVPSTTPQNVGELIALLSNEADGDINLGLSDTDDPLYSIDQSAVDAIELPYDVQTI